MDWRGYPQTLRGLAERLSRNRSYRRRLPQKYGGCRLYISPECGLSYWFGLGASEELLNNALEFVKPGSVVWDIGANIGLFSFAAAGLSGPTGRVYALEPDTTLINLLRRSARLNPHAAPVDIIPCAASESVSLARFNIASRSRASNFLDGFGATQAGGIRETQNVFTVSLDWMAERIPPPDVLKVDAEGAEPAVFRGAVHLLKSKRPMILFESLVGNRKELALFFSRFGYTFYDSDVPAARREPLREPAFNTLAVPS